MIHFLILFYLILFLHFTSGFFPIDEKRFLKLNHSYTIPSIYSNENSVNYFSKKISPLPGSSNSTTNFAPPTEVIVSPGISILGSDNQNLSYFVNITIGNEIYSLIVDTGSAYLWVYGESCTSIACYNKKLFSTKNVKLDNSSFSLSYSFGIASGQVYEDKVVVSGLSIAKNFTFGVADNVPLIFKPYLVSGIFGLPNHSGDIESPISVLYSSHAISMKKFSISLGKINARNSANEILSDNQGVLVIGEECKGLYTGDIYYNQLVENPNNYWLLKIENTFFENTLIRFTNYENFTDGASYYSRYSIIDSGTTLLILPKQDALELHSFFPNSITDGTNFAIYCNSTQNIIFQFGGKNWTLGADAYIGPSYSRNSELYGYCVSNIQGLNINKAWILGDIFLKTVYSVFDMETRKIGFAEKNPNAILVPQPTTSLFHTSISSTMSSLPKPTSSDHSSANIGMHTLMQLPNIWIIISTTIGIICESLFDFL